MVEAGQLLGLGRVRFIANEVEIKGARKRVDLVFQTEDNYFIIVESKASKTSKSLLGDHVKKGIEQLKEYKELIEKNGLDLNKEGLGIVRGENIKAYVVVYVFFDLENKEVKVGYEPLLP